ncbi:MAG: hypothetical protein KDD70_13290, partial [Bdellovibrionales bacterium]|nr:hypothetical protein [Bdellovibrionales bacterium]
TSLSLEIHMQKRSPKSDTAVVESTAASPFHAPSAGKRASSIIHQIFSAEHPESFTRSIPAEQLFLAVKEQGLASSSEVIEMASREQVQLMLDLDLWSYDCFEESQLWSWLELPDVTDDLQILQKVLHSVDPKLIAILILKYVEVLTYEDSTEAPPEVGFYTPDRGHTWLRVELEDEQQNFLMKRLLALIFETSAELFYQLLAVPSVATSSDLEEESYQEKSKRLEGEGFPNDQWAAELNAAADPAKLIHAVKTHVKYRPVEDLYSVPAFAQSYSIPEPLRGLLREVGAQESVQQELTLLCNSAFIHFRIPTWEQEQVYGLVEQLRGAINVGLSILLERSEEISPVEVYQSVGLKGLYQMGLSEIYPLRNTANTLSDDVCDSDPRLLAFLAGLQMRFPKLPSFLASDGTFEEVGGKLEAGFRVLETVEDIAVADLLLKKLQSASSS